MPLRGAGLAYRPCFNGPVAPTSGHHAYCRAMVVTVDIRAHRRKALFSPFIRCSGIGIARALSSRSEGRHWLPRWTPQPTSSERPRA